MRPRFHARRLGSVWQLRLYRTANFSRLNDPLSLGTTWQTWLSQDVALQGTSLGGSAMGQPAASNVRTNETIIMAPTLKRFSRFVSFLAMSHARCYGTRVLCHRDTLPGPTRERKYPASRGLLHRTLFDRHGLGIRYAMSHRDASYPNVDFRNQTVGRPASCMYCWERADSMRSTGANSVWFSSGL